MNITKSSQKKYLLVIAGPTAVGKTETSLRLAEYFQTEIISADSRQVYREMSIGTAKPTPEELARVPHHFINSHSIQDYFSVGQFEEQALGLLESLYKVHDVVILSGGTGFFIKALCDGLDPMPPVNLDIRDLLNKRFAEEGLGPILAELEKLDPIYFHKVDQDNTQRVIRGLEVCLSSGRPFSDFHRQEKKVRPFEILKIVLDRPREELYQRIDTRMDLMLEHGLFEEAQSMFPSRKHNALQTVGYQEIFSFLEGEYPWDEAVRLLKRNSRRYAKRQLTWFRGDPEFEWMPAEEYQSLLERVLTWINVI